MLKRIALCLIPFSIHADPTKDLLKLNALVATTQSQLPKGMLESAAGAIHLCHVDSLNLIIRMVEERNEFFKEQNLMTHIFAFRDYLLAMPKED